VGCYKERIFVTQNYVELLNYLETRSEEGPAVWPNFTAQDILRRGAAEGIANDSFCQQVEAARVGAHMRMAETRLRNVETDPETQADNYLTKGALKEQVLAHYRLAGEHVPQPSSAFFDRLEMAQGKLLPIIAERQLQRFEKGIPPLRDPVGIALYLEEIRDRFRAAGDPVRVSGPLQQRIIQAGASAEINGLRRRLDYFDGRKVSMLGDVEPNKDPVCIALEMLDTVQRHGLQAELLFRTRAVSKELLGQYGASSKPQTPTGTAIILTFSKSPS
jgi:hypothetical protein